MSFLGRSSGSLLHKHSLYEKRSCIPLLCWEIVSMIAWIMSNWSGEQCPHMPVPIQSVAEWHVVGSEWTESGVVTDHQLCGGQQSKWPHLQAILSVLLIDRPTPHNSHTVTLPYPQGLETSSDIKNDSGKLSCTPFRERERCVHSLCKINFHFEDLSKVWAFHLNMTCQNALLFITKSSTCWPHIWLIP